jgi:hypothetical protein
MYLVIVAAGDIPVFECELGNEPTVKPFTINTRGLAHLRVCNFRTNVI